MRVPDLLKKDRIREQFEQRVIADSPQQIERKVNELIDWLVDSDLRQWQAVNDHLADRRRVHQERIMGDLGPGTFTYDRERLMAAVGREAQRVVESYDKSSEAQAIAQGAQEAVAASAVLEVRCDRPGSTGRCSRFNCCSRRDRHLAGHVHRGTGVDHHPGPPPRRKERTA